MKDLICLLAAFFISSTHEATAEWIISKIEGNDNVKQQRFDNGNRGPVPKFTFIQDKAER